MSLLRKSNHKLDYLLIVGLFVIVTVFIAQIMRNSKLDRENAALIESNIDMKQRIDYLCPAIAEHWEHHREWRIKTPLLRLDGGIRCDLCGYHFANVKARKKTAITEALESLARPLGKDAIRRVKTKGK